MKFSIGTDVIAGGLKVAGRAIPSKTSLPVLENALLEAVQDDDGDYLAIAGTDLEIGLRTRVKAQVDEPGSVTLPAKLLTNLMSTWEQEAETFAELDEEKQTMHLECAGATAEVKGISADEYPIIADPSDWDNVSLDAFKLRGALDRVVFAAATSENRPILTGVYIHTEDEGLILAAADGFRMSAVSLYADLSETETPLDKGVIVPAASLRELTRLIPGAGKPVRVAFKPGQLAQIAFVTYDRNDKVENVLVSQLIDGNYPDYRQIVPKDKNLIVRCNTHLLRSAVQGALVFSSHNANIVRWYAKEDELAVVGTSTEMGHQDATLPIETDGWMGGMGDDDKKYGRVGKIAINGTYMLDALRAVDAAETEIALVTPSSPLVVRPVGDDGFVHVIMPMHLGT